MSLPLNLPNAIACGRIALIPIVVLAMLDARRGGLATARRRSVPTLWAVI